jgi:hypothetical protein
MLNYGNNKESMINYLSTLNFMTEDIGIIADKISKRGLFSIKIIFSLLLSYLTI